MPTSATTDRLRRGDPRAGFTLLELMLALALMALVASVAFPWTGFSSGPSALRAKAYEAAALLRADRNAARKLGRTVVTKFDAGNGALLSGASRDVVTLPASIRARMDGAAGAFQFFADGRSSGGSLALASRSARLDLEVGALTSAVEIRAPTGDAK